MGLVDVNCHRKTLNLIYQAIALSAGLGHSQARALFSFVVVIAWWKEHLLKPCLHICFPRVWTTKAAVRSKENRSDRAVDKVNRWFFVGCFVGSPLGV